MEDFKIIVRLLAAIYACDEKGALDQRLIQEEVLKTTAAKRDATAIRLQKAGLIEGLFVVDDVDNQPCPVVMWSNSNPRITLQGLEYMDSNTTFKRVSKELKDAGISLASQTVANIITNMH